MRHLFWCPSFHVHVIETAQEHRDLADLDRNTEAPFAGLVATIDSPDAAVDGEVGFRIGLGFGKREPLSVVEDGEGEILPDKIMDPRSVVREPTEHVV